MAWKLTIDAVDQTTKIWRGEPVTFARTLNERAMASFTCRPSLLPNRFADIIIYAQDGTTPLFRGPVLPGGRNSYGVASKSTSMRTDIEAGDAFTYLDWTLVSLTYTTTKTLKEILTDVVAALPGSTGVTLSAAQDDGPTLDPSSWVGVKAADVVRELSDRTGRVVRMSATKALSMDVPGGNVFTNSTFSDLTLADDAGDGAGWSNWYGDDALTWSAGVNDALATLPNNEGAGYLKATGTPGVGNRVIKGPILAVTAGVGYTFSAFMGQRNCAYAQVSVGWKSSLGGAVTAWESGSQVTAAGGNTLDTFGLSELATTASVGSTHVQLRLILNTLSSANPAVFFSHMWFGKTADRAPNTIADAAWHCDELEWADLDQVPANAITVLCGPTGTFPATQAWTGNGVTEDFVTDIAAWGPSSRGVVTVGGVDQTVSEVGGGAQWEWDPDTHTLYRGTASIPGVGVAIEFAYTAVGPFAVTATSGATPVIAHQESAPDVMTLAVGQELADGLLAKLNQPYARELTIYSREHGWEPGQRLEVMLTARNVWGSFVITSVDVTLDSDNVWRYTLKASESSVYQGDYQAKWRALTAA